MDVGELIATGGLAEEIKSECPFKDDVFGVDSVEPEDIKDDIDAAQKQQDNDGGVLGRNLVNASNGAEGTVGGPCPPPDAQKVERGDTKRKGICVMVPGTGTIPEGIYGFTVAAHHLIPGEASLEPSPLKPYMTKDQSVEVQTKEGKKTKKIRKHIGYNVNGAHNGVWLPGSYYIRRSTSPIKGKTWSDLGENPWCLTYVASVVKAAGGQFHDAHTKYSEAVKDLLAKIEKILSQHECDQCKPSDINPPFKIKNRLYNLSKYLRGQVTAPPSVWKRPWFTSDRWRDDAFSAGRPSGKFIAAYLKAKVVNISTPGNFGD
ncbi:hypothetical protein FBQ96_04510 [Nitrospirales bacterium NOB]|nr:hypothetical protein [Nitrospirales bacterium NOB]